MKRHLFLFLLAAAFPAIAGAATLERAVVLVRHGVRSPTATAERLKAETGYDWPVWGVAPGEMTAHGAEALSTMGAFLAGRYQELGILPHAGCGSRGGVAVWADNADNRTRQSGQVLAGQLAPGCGLYANWQTAPGHDPVFDAVGSGAEPVDQGRTMAALDAALAAPLPGPVSRALALLQGHFDPGGCSAGGATCLMGPNRAKWKNAMPSVSGGLPKAATATENLLLVYEEGFPPGQIAHAQSEADARDLLTQVLPVHVYETLMTRRQPDVARARGAVLAQLVIEGLVKPGPSVLVLAGHDSNLDALSSIFSLDWQFPDQPDPTAPDTALAFELWRQADGQQELRTFLFYQTPDQVRHRLTLQNGGRPHVMEVRSVACGGVPGTCPLSGIERSVEGKLSRGEEDRDLADRAYRLIGEFRNKSTDRSSPGPN